MNKNIKEELRRYKDGSRITSNSITIYSERKTSEKFTVKLQKIELENFKNVKNGEILLQSYMDRNNEKISESNDNYSNNFIDSSDILGIYGQNGSGKTALIDALSILKDVVSGKSLEDSVSYLISNGQERALCKFTFYIKDESNKEYIVYYNFGLNKIYLQKNGSSIQLPSMNGGFTEDIKVKVMISDEYLGFSNIENGKILKKINIVAHDYLNGNKDTIFTPERVMKTIKKDYNTIDLKVERQVLMNEQKSFIFGLFEKNNETTNIMINGIENIKMPLNALYSFTKDNLIIIRNDRLRDQSTKYEPIPFGLIIYSNATKQAKEYYISSNKGLQLTLTEFKSVEETIKKLNIVIDALIPGLSIGIYNTNKITLPNGLDGYYTELVSIRDGYKMPLVCESDGIKKIISILSSIIAMCNDEKVCLVVDELDAGVYEYLLGELLYVLEKKSKGQFIFTSHNLRALETLSKDCVIFTTTNPNNRYIRLNNIKGSKTVRDFYIRSIVIGGQKEKLYNETDRYDIEDAFEDAWGDEE